MSLNLGAAMVASLQNLSRHPDMTDLRAHLARLVSEKTHAAMESLREDRIEATAYARALRDFFVSVEVACLGIRHNQVEKPDVSPPIPEPAPAFVVTDFVPPPVATDITSAMGNGAGSVLADAQMAKIAEAAAAKPAKPAKATPGEDLI